MNQFEIIKATELFRNVSVILAERLVMANINMQDMMSRHHQIGV